MTNITVVTTFHKAGLELYGQRFLDSFANRVDKNIKLVVYAEDCNPTNPDPKQIVIKNAHDIKPLVKFKEQWKDVPKANGIPPDEIKNRRKDWNKAFKWDAVRFSHKVYAIFEEFFYTKVDWLVWMDADTYVHSSISYDEFKELLPDYRWLTFVGRGKGSQTWPECGFYGMNVKHTVCQNFIRDFKGYYDDAENGIFKLEEWHDSYVFGHLLNEYKNVNSAGLLDYSADMYLKEAKTGGGGHPLINTVLGKYFDHMKGDRKNTGKSLAKDLMIDRTEDYWK